MLAYFDRVFATDEGKLVLKHIKEEICRFEKTTVSYNTNKTLDPNAMALNEGRRMVWKEIQKFLRTEVLIDMEKLKLKGDNNV